MALSLTISLNFEGRDADRNQIDLYDAAEALKGFQRSLALTTHLILNDEIITQAPSLKGARILSAPPQEGSWKAVALIIGGAWTVATAQKDSPIGNLVYSAYDYVIKETLGFHVDYSKSLGQLYEEYKSKHPEIKKLSQARFDSLSERCESAVRDMHRPISLSGTATTAGIFAERTQSRKQLGVYFDAETADYIYQSVRSKIPSTYTGEVTGYNSDTHKGRVYVETEGRRISFFLDEGCRKPAQLLAITNSLTANTQRTARYEANSKIRFSAFTDRTISGRLKSFHIISAETFGKNMI